MSRHRPEDTVLYGAVEEHLETSYRVLGERGTSLPAFVHAEFERYLRCGRLEHDFVRVKCAGRCHEHLVALSCQFHGFCPSCGACSRGRMDDASTPSPWLGYPEPSCREQT